MSPVRTAVLDAHDIDVAGLAALLRRHEERIELVEDRPEAGPAEVILYGVRRHLDGHDSDLHRLLRHEPATVIALGWGSDSVQIDWALSCGAHGRLSKTLSGEHLVAGIEAIHLGREAVGVLPPDGRCHPELARVGLTPRECQVLALITRGCTNQEIAEELFVSINSVKTYVRAAYRKIGATRRAHAVGWGVWHGLDLGGETFLDPPVL